MIGYQLANLPNPPSANCADADDERFILSSNE